jgi:hypothetical protein
LFHFWLCIEHGQCDENTGAAPASLRSGSTRLRDHVGGSNLAVFRIGKPSKVILQCPYNTAMGLIAISISITAERYYVPRSRPFKTIAFRLFCSNRGRGPYSGTLFREVSWDRKVSSNLITSFTLSELIKILQFSEVSSQGSRKL